MNTSLEPLVLIPQQYYYVRASKAISIGTFLLPLKLYLELSYDTAYELYRLSLSFNFVGVEGENSYEKWLGEDEALELFVRVERDYRTSWNLGRKEWMQL